MHLLQKYQKMYQNYYKINNTGVVTTGPVVKDNSVNSLVVKTLNNTPNSVSITITVYDLTQCPKTPFQTTNLVVPSGCAVDTIFDRPPFNYEVRIDGVIDGVNVWSGARSNNTNAPIKSSNFVPTNTFRHSDFARGV